MVPRNVGILPHHYPEDYDFTLKMEAAWCSEMLESYDITTLKTSSWPWRWWEHGPPKRWYPPISLPRRLGLAPENGVSMVPRNADIL